jgi:hypothetical protein
MATEIALFWMVVAGFLLADNLVLAPLGGDYLRFGARGRLRYHPGSAFELRGRMAVLLNPLNPFDRIVLTHSADTLAAPQVWRTALRSLRRAMFGLNALSALGSVYLALLLVLLAVSCVIPFAVVLVTLLATHLCVWFLAALLVLRYRRSLSVTHYQALVLLVEALFVPAYVVNLGKRAWFRVRMDVPALVLGMREFHRTHDAERELLGCRLLQRLDQLVEENHEPPAWIEEAQQCLKASLL